MRRLMLCLWGTAGIALATPVLAAPAHTYRADLDRLTAEFNAIGFQDIVKPGQAHVRGQAGHDHTAGQIAYMQQQIRFAYRDCAIGNDDAVRTRIAAVRTALRMAGG